MSYPLISIVTASYNQGHFIEETINSVLDQHYPNLEYIIIDGGSTDNSVEIIQKYASQLKYWISEKDNGQANGINKGLKYCSGEIFNWLNSDDYLTPGSLVKIAAAFEDQSVQMVAGTVRNFSSTAETIIANRNLSAAGLMCWKPGVQFMQPGAWMRRELVNRCGGIDEEFHYAFDWDLYIRYLYHFPSVMEIPDLLANFRLHDLSKTQLMNYRFVIEEQRIIEKISLLPDYGGLKKTCRYKLQKADWTAFLSKQSKSQESFFQKCMAVVQKLPLYKKVSFSRQTAGAIKAFWQHKQI